MSQQEIWKDVKDFEGIYQVSNLGRIKSMARIIQRKKMGLLVLPEKILNPHVDKVGYPRLYLYKKDCKERRHVHRIVAMAFIPNPENKPIINHRNGVKADNSVNNLEWCTQKENIRHSFDEKLQVAYKGEECSFSKLSEKDVLLIRKLWRTHNYTQKEIGYMFGVSRGAIKAITLNKNWRHVQNV